MDLNEALQRIGELEQELKAARAAAPQAADARLLERLKADMRQAARTRDEAERRARDLEGRLLQESRRRRAGLAAMRAGCVDVGTFLTAMEAQGLPEPDAAEEALAGWLESARAKHPYFFAAGPDGPSAPPAAAPLVAAGLKPAVPDPKRQAALAYRTA